MGEDVGAADASLIDGRAQLLDGELCGVDRVSRRGCAAGGHYVDVGGAAAELVAGGLAHRVGAVADDEASDKTADAMLDRVLVGCPPVSVPAGLREKGSAWQDSRTAEEALVDDLRPGRIEPAGIADGCEALVERLFDECGNAQGEGGQGARRPAVGLGGGEMDVRVDEGGVVEKERGHISTARRGGARPHLSRCECHLSHPPARYVILLKSGDTP